MAGLVVKIIVCPVVVYLCSILFPHLLYYPFTYEPIVVGLILAVAAHMMEVWLLRKGTFWSSNILDFVAAVILIYVVSFFMPGSKLLFTGVLLTALFLTVTEYIQHLWLISTGRTRKA
ncbi:MAG: hypothetical protein JWN30_1138 [Bacilli bacterium]|nr:hypothetical protein [Bacilli bacterium]